MDVGQTIFSIRKSKGMTIKEVSELSHVSASLISQIENNKANPSLATLQVLAEALQVNVASFFQASPQEKLSIRSSERLLDRIEKGVSHYLITRARFNNVSITLRVYDDSFVKRERPIGEFDGYEFVYVLSGELSIQVEDTIYSLNQGDTICFESLRPHRVIGPLSSRAEAIWINIYNN